MAGLFSLNDRVFFVSQGNVAASMDSNLLGDLFLQGRCSVSFYEFRSTCYSIIHPPSDVRRSAAPEADAISQLCQQSIPQELRDCKHHLGGHLCPVVITPHNDLEAAYLRSLIDRFGSPLEAAWVGLKSSWNNVFVRSQQMLLLLGCAFVRDKSVCLPHWRPWFEFRKGRFGSQPWSPHQLQCMKYCMMHRVSNAKAFRFCCLYLIGFPCSAASPPPPPAVGRPGTVRLHLAPQFRFSAS